MAREARRAQRTHRRHRGMALPSALMFASMMLATSAAWLEASIAQTRLSAGVHEHLRATQAADGALALCVEALRAGVAPVLPAPLESPPPWMKVETFDGPAAYEPVPSWPGSASAPRCVIEALRVEGRADAGGYRITARGFGATRAAQAWLQLALWREGGRERRAWRRIVTLGAVE
jgi:Tfp pilus assembly protein PilX